jgi:hypothetical protein
MAGGLFAGRLQGGIGLVRSCSTSVRPIRPHFWPSLTTFSGICSKCISDIHISCMEMYYARVSYGFYPFGYEAGA